MPPSFTDTWFVAHGAARVALDGDDRGDLRLLYCPRPDESRPTSEREGSSPCWLVIGILLKIVIVASVLLGAVAYLIYVERKVAAYAQDRIGPNRAGREFGIPFGLLQPLADGAKMLLKEDVVPGYVNKPLYILAPMIAIIAAMIAFAVVPFGPVGPDQCDRFPDRPRRRYRHPLHLRGRQPGGLRRHPGRLGVE